ncbi:MAG: hypothetical protein QNJ85_11985 [Gammaproteobacteria bacterium]|nr:hypothetical protein [Gammaproteobacteria bacterium]
MALVKTALKAARKIDEALDGYDLSDAERKAILKIIEKSIVQTVEEAASEYQETTAACCGPEKDLAHKIAEEIERKHKALIANLSAMR